MHVWYNPHGGATIIQSGSPVRPGPNWVDITKFVERGPLGPRLGTDVPRKGMMGETAQMAKPRQVARELSELGTEYIECRTALLELVVEIRLSILESAPLLNEAGDQEVIMNVEELKRKLIKAENFLSKIDEGS